jgi:histidine triad (HIT) family protein
MQRPVDPDCLFCQIAAGSIPAQIVYQDEDALAFVDINPQAPTHVLVIPRAHRADLVALAADPDATSALVKGLAATAQALGLTDFRTVVNTGAAVGQSVFHVHAHVLAGRSMQWPPG